MKNIACSDCVVTAMLGPIPDSLDEHKEILEVLSSAGLVSPLRLVIGEGKGTEVNPGAIAQ